MDRFRHLEMVRVDGDHWVVRGRTPSPGGGFRVLARVTEAEDGFDVVWVDVDPTLPRRFRVRADILAELERRQSPRAGWARPVEIPSFPPFLAARRRRRPG